MSLDRFENIDEVLGISPTYGETFLEKDRNLIEPLTGSIDAVIDGTIIPNLRITSNVAVGRTAGILKEMHVYSDDVLLESFYDEPIEKSGSLFYLNPEQDLRSMGFDQGSYNMVYNTMYKFAGNVEQPQLVIKEISSDRTEVKVKIRDKWQDQIGLQESIITLKQFYDDETLLTPGGNSFVYGIGKEEFLLNCGENQISDISHILFEGTKTKYAPYPQSFFNGLKTIWINVHVSGSTFNRDQDGRRGSYFAEYYQSTGTSTGRAAFWRLGAPPSTKTLQESPPQLDEKEDLNWYIEQYTETDYTIGYTEPPYNKSTNNLGAPFYFWYGLPNFLGTTGTGFNQRISQIDGIVKTLIDNQKNRRQERWERRYIAGLALATGISTGEEYDPPGSGLGYFAGALGVGGAAFVAGSALQAAATATFSTAFWAAGGGLAGAAAGAATGAAGGAVVGAGVATGGIALIVAALIGGGILIGNKETFEGELERTVRAYEEIIGYHQNSLNRLYNNTWRRGVALGNLTNSSLDAAEFLVNECKRNLIDLDAQWDALPSRKRNNGEGRVIERYMRVHATIALQVGAWLNTWKKIIDLQTNQWKLQRPADSKDGVYVDDDYFPDLNINFTPIPTSIWPFRLNIYTRGVPYRVMNTTSGAQYGFTNLILKLHKPLPDEIEEGRRVGIYGRLQKSYIEKIIAWRILGDLEIPFWSEPNFNIPLDGWGASIYTDYKSWKDLLPLSASNQLVDKYFSEKPQNLNIDYSGFKNFIKYSSAVERLDVFMNKIQKIEEYNARIATLTSVSGQYSNVNISQSVLNRDNLISNFDGFENWLYYHGSGSYLSNGYKSSSLYTHYPVENSIVPYPKISTKPYQLYGYNSPQVEGWYAGVYSSASLFDTDNGSKLSKLIPFAIAEDILNTDYIKFIDMVGHFFDMIWNAVREMTSINERQEHPDDGMPDELLYSVANSMGWKLADGYGTSNLWEYTLGTSTTGSILPTTASMNISGSVVVKPKQKVKYEIWRRLLNNLPYIYKTKGTRQSIETIMSCYGISEEFLKIKEYGGPILTQSLSVHDNQFFVGGMLQNSTNNKIRIESSTLNGEFLDTDSSRVTSQFDDAPLDSNLLGVYFTTTDTLNTHMYSWSFQSTGDYSLIDQWIGDPIDRRKTYYPTLRITSSQYFGYLNTSQNIRYQDLSPANLLLNLVSNYDDSIFSQIDQVIPARANYYSGILIEPHILERNKLHWPGVPSPMEVVSPYPIRHKGGVIPIVPTPQFQPRPAPKPGSSTVNQNYSGMASNYSGVLPEISTTLDPASNFQPQPTPVVQQFGARVEPRSPDLTVVPYRPTGYTFSKARIWKSGTSLSYIGEPPIYIIESGSTAGQSIFRYDTSNLDDALQPSEIQPNGNYIIARGSRWSKSFDGTPVVEVYRADPFVLQAADASGVFGGVSTEIASNPKGISAVANVLLEQPRRPILPTDGGAPSGPTPSARRSAGSLDGNLGGYTE